MRSRRLQIRGGPSVRQVAFDQARVASEFNRHVGEVRARVEALIRGHGAFHAKVHFSTGLVTLWLLSDPLRYRVHVQEEFLDPDFALAYPRLPFTPEAVVPSVAVDSESAGRVRTSVHARPAGLSAFGLAQHGQRACPFEFFLRCQ